MLAFTVQFSRYGRKPGSLGASAPRESGSVVSQRPTAASSGPNSVLTQTEVPCARSVAPRRENVLAAPSRADLSE
jgi:hypothetical protein